MLPVDKEGEKVTLNLNARFFWEDIPFGLVILKDIGRLAGMKTPNIDKMIVFHQNLMPVKYVDEEKGTLVEDSLRDSGAPARYGIKTLEELVSMSREKKK